MPSLLFPPVVQFVDADGHPYAAGTIETYIVGTSTPKITWSEHSGSAANTNPIVLDSAGRAIMFGDGEYRLVLRAADGTLVWDQYSTSIVSAAMQAVVVAPTLADARRLLGVDDAVAAEAQARAAADSYEATTRAEGDASLLAAIDNEATARGNGDAALLTALNNETARAEAAEAALAAQITTAPPAPGVGGGAVSRSGTSTTNASGVFTATWATFSVAFSGILVDVGDPAQPGSVISPTTTTLSSYTGTLTRTNNLYPTPTSAPIATTTFHWTVWGW